MEVQELAINNEFHGPAWEEGLGIREDSTRNAIAGEFRRPPMALIVKSLRDIWGDCSRDGFTIKCCTDVSVIWLL